MTDPLQECEDIIAEYKAAADFMADMLEIEIREKKQLRISLRSMAGQLQLLLTDCKYEARM